MNKCRYIIHAFILISIVTIIILFAAWYSEQEAEKNLQDYITRLEEEGFTVTKYSLADFDADGLTEIHFFCDFLSVANQKSITHMYFDRGIHGIYF